MAPDIDSPTSEGSDLALRWSGRVSLTRRILAVNIIALAMLAGGFFYLDSYRSRLVDSRVDRAQQEARLAVEALRIALPAQRDDILRRLSRDMGARLRLFDAAGALVADTKTLGMRSVVLADPDRQPWNQSVARFLDAGIDTVVGAPRPPLYREPRDGVWRDVVTARATGRTAATVWRAPDRTPVITAAAPLPSGALLTTVNARDITQIVRVERFRLSVVLMTVTLASILLSLFLARTIVRPLRRLARAAVRVRLGRAREVVVPRLPERRDELGMLARALSDMSLALRARIDATEAFAADVTHELKNPLASLRSAVEALGNVRDEALQARLLAIVRDDVHRLDRLITDISEASRLDAQLSRTTFEPIDVAALVEGLLRQRMERSGAGVQYAVERPPEAIMVLGDDLRLERVIENLLDNAASFSPAGGRITVSLTRADDNAEIRVDDEGPGVPEDARETIFQRFRTIRPEGEEFGRHSGLGLAIARTIVEAHQGTIEVDIAADRERGARFAVCLPLMADES